MMNLSCISSNLDSISFRKKEKKKKPNASFLEVSPKSYKIQNTNMVNMVMHNSITENLQIYFTMDVNTMNLCHIVFNVT